MSYGLVGKLPYHPEFLRLGPAQGVHAADRWLYELFSHLPPGSSLGSAFFALTLGERRIHGVIRDSHDQVERRFPCALFVESSLPEPGQWCSELEGHTDALFEGAELIQELVDMKVEAEPALTMLAAWAGASHAGAAPEPVELWSTTFGQEEPRPTRGPALEGLGRAVESAVIRGNKIAGTSVACPLRSPGGVLAWSRLAARKLPWGPSLMWNGAVLIMQLGRPTHRILSQCLDPDTDPNLVRLWELPPRSVGEGPWPELLMDDCRIDPL